MISVSPLARYTVIPLKIREYILCVISAVMLIFSFPNFNLWILAWVGFVPLFLAIEKKSKTKAFLLSYLTGVIFWLGTIYWLVHVTLPGMILLVLYLALYFGLFGLLITRYILPTTYYILFIPSLWVLLEYARSHLLTGFPWALLGYSQYLNLPAIQIADITGAWGVSFLIMMVNILIYRVITIAKSKNVPPSQPNRGRDSACSLGTHGGKISNIEKINIIFAIFILVFSFAYGYYMINGQRANGQTDKPIRISVIQGNIPQELKWEPSSREFIVDKYFTLSREAAQDKPDFIIWPEAAVPVPLEESSDYYKSLISFVKEINIPVLLGAVTSKDNLYYYNSALFFQGGESLLSKYDKIHLVPFGEYIPLRKILSFLETVVPIGDFAPGKRYTLFKVPGFPLSAPGSFAVLICFEDIFPELAQRFVREGAGLLVNITNDAWFKQTSSPYQHLSASVFRAVENRVFLVRAANTGVSGFIRPDGRVFSSVKDTQGKAIFVEGYKTDEVVISKSSPAFYTRFGDIFILVCVSLVLYAIILRFL